MGNGHLPFDVWRSLGVGEIVYGQAGVETGVDKLEKLITAIIIGQCRILTPQSLLYLFPLISTMY